MKIKKVAVGAVALLAVLAGAGCSVADPDTSQSVLHYTAGPFESQAFSYCVAPGVRNVGGANDLDFYYPNGIRTFAFTGLSGAESQPLTVSAKGGIQLISSGTLAFRLNTSCEPYTDAKGVQWPGGKLQKFHDLFGKQLGAYASDGGQAQPEGWNNALRTYIGQALDRAMDQAGLKYAWQDLSQNPDVQNAWQADVETALPKLLNEQMGDDLFLIENIQPGRPSIPQALLTENENREAAGLRQQTAAIDQRAASTFPGGINAYLEYQRQVAVNDAIKSGKVNPLIVPDGSSIVASPR